MWVSSCDVRTKIAGTVRIAHGEIRAAAMTGESIGIPSHLSLPLFAIRRQNYLMNDNEQSAGSPDRWLSLAAAPTFALMALLTRIHGGSMPEILCSAGQAASPLNGMVSMYLFMSALHVGPWLRLPRRPLTR